MPASYEQHLVADVWRKLQPDRTKLSHFEVIAGSSPPTTVYRLGGAGKAGSNVIAKRCLRRTALIERAVYEQILPKLPLPMVHYYGFSEEPDSEFCWLFVEDVSHEKYDPRSKQHRTAAARWLGVMNMSAQDIVSASRLPLRMPEHYLTLLASARNTMLLSSDNSALKSADLAILKAVVTHCDHLNATWHQLENACARMPHTLVHGDFIRKNVGVRTTTDGIVLLPFDWENAGWGISAEDISKVDITVYWLTVKSHWPELDVQSFKRMASVGEIFRCLVFLYWIAPRLAGEKVKQPLSDLRLCEHWLANLIQEEGWKS